MIDNNPKQKSSLPIEGQFEVFVGRAKPEILDTIGALRVEVWSNSGYPMTVTFPDGKWFDPKDEVSTHLTITDKSRKLVAASRLTIATSVSDLLQGDWFSGLTETPKAPFGFISRLVVAASFKNRGLGYFLDSECIRLSQDAGATSVFCDVPEYRINGLKRRGFKVVQEPRNGDYFPTLKWAAMLLPLQKAGQTGVSA